MKKLEAVLKHGWGFPVEYRADGAMITAPRSFERVPCKETEAPLSGRTATGYGSKLPTAYMLQWRGKWRRVKCVCFSNSGSLYIADGNEKIFVDIEEKAN